MPNSTPDSPYAELVPEDFDLRYERAFGLLAFTANRHLINHMRRLCIDLGTDLDTAFIWGTLAHLNVLPNLPLNAHPMTFLNELGLKADSKIHPIRLAELAEITGIPRETIRRKLNNLSALGKVKKTPDGRWIYLSSGIGVAERLFTKETILQLLRTAQALNSLLSQVDVSKESPPSTEAKGG